MQTHNFLAQLDPDGCKELPFVTTATQTYYDYVNGASGFLVLIVGITLLGAALISRKWLTKVPGWLALVVIVALALGSLPVLLPVFGIDLGCGTNGAGGGVGTQVQQPVAVIPEEN